MNNELLKKFALVGNPNSGKTTLFNSLTGSTAHVGNWPGVTVDKKEGLYKKKGFDDCYIIDLPGIYSLSPYTDEEIVARNYILDEHPDVVINIVDATNLERNLYLTTQLLEIDVPLVVALNMSDVIKRNGDKIDVERLSQKLNVPVVEISALKQENLDTLMSVALIESKKKRLGNTIIENKDLLHLIGDVKIAFRAQKVQDPLFHAIKLVELDELETKMHPDLIEIVEEFKHTFNDSTFGNDFEGLIADARYNYISKHYNVVKKKDDKSNLTNSDKIDKVLTHKIWALPIFVFIMFIIFHVTFSEDLFFLNRLFGVGIKNEQTINVLTGMGYEEMVNESIDEAFETLELSDTQLDNDPESKQIYDQIVYYANLASIDLNDDEQVMTFKENLVTNYLENHQSVEFIDVSLEGVPSIGVFLQSWFGFATGELIGLVSNIMPNDTWYTSLLVDGVLTGIDAVLSFIPQIIILFLFIAILEDSGYMARVAFILDRAFRRFGLSGKAFIPMLTGFGCSVPAIMATRTLEDSKEKNRTIRLMTCFSCGAKAPIWALLASIGGLAGFAGDIFVFSIYVGGIAAAIIFALFMKLFSKDQYVSPFIMELPSYHLPQARNVIAHLWEKLKHYVIKAATIIAAATIVIWFLSNFKWAFWEGMVSIEESMLSDLGRILRYFFYPLGCLENGWTNSVDGWKYSVSVITGLIAKENVVATMAELGLKANNIGLNVAGAYSFAIYNLFTLPCFAAIGAAYGEQKGKEFVKTLVWWFVISYCSALIIYWLIELITYSKLIGIIVLVVLLGLIASAGIIVSNKNKRLSSVNA